MSNMKEYLDHLPEDKLRRMLAIKQAYERGEVTLAEAQEAMKRDIGSVRPSDIALMEQTLTEESEDECQREDMHTILRLFDEVMDISRPSLPDDHPIMCYYRENDAFRQHLLAVEDLIQYPVIKSQWIDLYNELAKVKIHFSRKQNQLYALLEQKGFDRPTTTMWTFDNAVRDQINANRALLEEGKEDDFIAAQTQLLDEARDLMEKEETVLYPTSLAMIREEEFEEMKEGDAEIGFAWIEAPTAAPKAPVVETAEKEGEFAKELSSLLAKHGYAANVDDVLDVATGKLTLEQINLIYRHMPVDLAYVDESRTVCFYTDSAHRVFPRSKNVIGRDVTNCHPRSSVHVVEEIIEKFKSGEESTAEFWINKPGLFVYIHYVAVRDEAGRFRGVLEMMQDCTHIRALEGSRTLLTWGSDHNIPEENSPEEKVEAKVSDEAMPSEESPQSLADLQPLGADTRLATLLALDPALKEEMPRINPKFSMLNTPLARLMIPKATLGMIAERGNMSLDELIAKIENFLTRKDK